MARLCAIYLSVVIALHVEIVWMPWELLIDLLVLEAVIFVEIVWIGWNIHALFVCIAYVCHHILEITQTV